MLILTRKRGQMLRIGKDIRVYIIDCDSQGARIGIEAPDNVEILREEAKNRQPKRRGYR